MSRLRKKLAIFDLVRRSIVKSDKKFIREKVVDPQKEKIAAIQKYEHLLCENDEEVKVAIDKLRKGWPRAFNREYSKTRNKFDIQSENF